MRARTSADRVCARAARDPPLPRRLAPALTTPDALRWPRRTPPRRRQERGGGYESTTSAQRSRRPLPDWGELPPCGGSALSWDGRSRRVVARRAPARQVYPRLANTSSVAVVAGVGLDCAVALPDDDPSKVEAVAFFEDAAARRADRSIPMSDDDRSGVHDSRLSAREAAKDSTGQREGDRMGVVPGRSGRSRLDPGGPRRLDCAPTLCVPRAGAGREGCADAAGVGARLPRRLQPAGSPRGGLCELHCFDDALAASDRAARGYGPRLTGILRTPLDIFLAKGDTTAARATLEDALAHVSRPRGSAVREHQGVAAEAAGRASSCSVAAAIARRFPALVNRLTITMLMTVLTRLLGIEQIVSPGR